MGLLDSFFGKKTPEIVIAHILDPKRGYFTQRWSVGKDVPGDMVSRLAEGKELYVLWMYEHGERKQIVCKKEMWFEAKAQFAAIDEAGASELARIKSLLDRLR